MGTEEHRQVRRRLDQRDGVRRLFGISRHLRLDGFSSCSGLFEKAILQSGFCVDNTAPTLAAVEAQGKNLAQKLGVSGNDTQTLDQLRAVPAEQLLQQAAADHEIDFNPNVE